MPRSLQKINSLVVLGRASWAGLDGAGWAGLAGLVWAGCGQLAGLSGLGQVWAGWAGLAGLGQAWVGRAGLAVLGGLAQARRSAGQEGEEVYINHFRNHSFRFPSDAFQVAFRWGLNAGCH